MRGLNAVLVLLVLYRAPVLSLDPAPTEFSTIKNDERCEWFFVVYEVLVYGAVMVDILEGSFFD